MNLVGRIEIEQFVEERNEALFSLDKQTILKFARKYNVPFPTSEKGFWGGVYKAILGINDTPEDIQKITKKWLKENEMSEHIY